MCEEVDKLRAVRTILGALHIYKVLNKIFNTDHQIICVCQRIKINAKGLQTVSQALIEYDDSS